ncbi:leucyl aminopeptidase family protein [Marilutibacter alkalisoli]|uniref:Leucyl aminopeptidase family protein n=1 Tax=Marilutibacter alkalisoli TaxID=2591633 RepID=A0A514BUW7_9GAMM|nr:leucyl aminopeptidase family protein [Lysobacter alkalisoli]QDH71170.1 leucyl aminopeptidase family protein [Lysobacter alkalisoli]
MTLPEAFTTETQDALPLHVTTRGGFNDWLQAQPATVQAWVGAQGFDGSAGSALVLPDAEGAMAGAVIGVEDPLDPCAYGHAPFALPARSWSLATEPDASASDDSAPGDSTPGDSTPGDSTPGNSRRAALELGWGLGSYRFTRYKAPLRAPAQLVVETADGESFDVLAACTRVRDLVNTPTEDMGPDQLETVVRGIGKEHGAEVEAVTGDELLKQNFPAIHAVGRASHRAPRLIALHWGDEGQPHLCLVGKGVCFDSGGLDIKPADGMRNMKKDMGGAAHAIALAELVMARKLPVRLTLLVPAVENSIGPNAFRPGEVIATRKGISVEIDNTDAEGRLVLCDALAHAGELSPDLIVDFATLTGAARIALGPDLPALFANDDILANAWLNAGEATRDPVWRMPLWRPYLRYLTSNIADMANSGSKMAGAVTAALYLERFVPGDKPWAHLDVYAWSDNARPGRPAGGEALGLRSAFAMLKARYRA